jgi:hypothetical protein
MPEMGTSNTENIENREITADKFQEEASKKAENNNKEIEKSREESTESDKFSPKEQKEIVDKIILLLDKERGNLSEWIEKKKKSLKMSYNSSPSEIENLSKKDWMSDRNIGFCGATCDAIRTTLFSTCYNPDSIHAQPTEKNDVDRAGNVEKFIKAIVTDPRNKVENEFKDCCDNVVRVGVGFMKIYWNVDIKYINQRSWKNGKLTIEKGVEKRFEYAKIVNIANVDNIVCSDDANDINDLPFFSEKVSLYGADIKRFSKLGLFVNVDEKFKAKVVGCNPDRSGLDEVKKDEQEISADYSELDFDVAPVDVIEAYLYFEKNGREEKYRFYIHEETETFLGGKPLRDVIPSGRLPYVCIPFDKITGKLRARSMPELIGDISNQINTCFNQKTDFQYTKNCPTGFYDPADPNVKGTFELEPNKMYPTNSPQSVQLHRGGGSETWAIQDIQLLMEMGERISGAASYFLASNSKQSTATRDSIVAQKSDTRIGIWVKALLVGESDIFNMAVELYQAFAPSELGTRLLGKDGKNLFDNFSAEQIQGYYDVKLSPDIVAGSKAYKASLALNRYDLLSKNPLVMQYPVGLWNLTYDTLKETGTDFPDKYLPNEPKDEQKLSEEIENEFFKFQQGDIFEPPEGGSVEAIAHLKGHFKQFERLHLIPKEHQHLFTDHIFKTQLNIKNFKSEMMNEQIANQLVLNMQGGSFGATNGESQSTRSNGEQAGIVTESADSGTGRFEATGSNEQAVGEGNGQSVPIT